MPHRSPGVTFHGASEKKVLIYRLGSIGDTVVALPALRRVAEAFPDAERRVLTHFPEGAKMAPMETILGPLNLVHGYFRYPLRTRDPRTLTELAREIRAWGPRVMVYLTPPRGRLKAFRDVLFFLTCGIRRFIGVPWTKGLQHCRKLDHADLWEPEADRLLRSIACLGNGMSGSPSTWDLGLTEAERAKARQALMNWSGRERFVCASIGTKAWVKDWGEDRWEELFRIFSARRPATGLVLVGSADEADLSNRLARAWKGPVLNLCGELTPRETAAAMERAAVFVGHDSGPMHLAAAVGTPCVAIFSGRNLPGEWYPFGKSHRIFYHKTPCFGCRLVDGCPHDKACIRSVTAQDVLCAMETFGTPES
jgi:ADP-heptose:LPS heptosyltransferase